MKATKIDLKDKPLGPLEIIRRNEKVRYDPLVDHEWESLVSPEEIDEQRFLTTSVDTS